MRSIIEEKEPFLEKKDDLDDELAKPHEISPGSHIEDPLVACGFSGVKCQTFIDLEDFSDFSVPFYKMPCKRLFSLGMIFLSQSFVLTLQTVVPMIMSMMNYFYLRNYQNPIYQAASAIVDNYQYSVFMSFYIGLYELIAVQCSKQYGAKNYAKCTATLVQTLSLLMLMYIPMIFLGWYSEQILCLVNVDVDVAEMAGSFIRYSMLAVFLEGVNFQLVGFCIAQGINLPFLFGN